MLNLCGFEAVVAHNEILLLKKNEDPVEINLIGLSINVLF